MFKPQPYLFAVLACVACAGSKFEAGGAAGDGSGAGASESAAGASTAGASTAGADSAGSSGDANTGGRAAAGGSGESGGAAAGGDSAAGAAGSDCAALKTEYAALISKARVCDKGSTDECTTGSQAPALSCGCPTQLNVKSEYTAQALAKYQEIEKASCNNGAVCNIACPAPTMATCSQSSGSGAPEFMCAGSIIIAP